MEALGGRELCPGPRGGAGVEPSSAPPALGRCNSISSVHVWDPVWGSGLRGAGIGQSQAPPGVCHFLGGGCDLEPLSLLW